MEYTSLNSIKEIINDDLKRFDLHFREAIASRVSLLDKISYYIVKTKGKQFRPILSLLSAKMLGPINESTYTAATMVELLHTATLVHDDVVDDSDQRRGFFSINALWKNKIAVLVGDYLLSRGLLVALERDQFGMLKILSRAVTDMSEGELLQLEKARRLDINRDIYFEIIQKKTASLIAAAVTCGAQSVTTDVDKLDKIWQFGIQLGIAFQIKDDLMDLSDHSIGKPLINDIKEKKMTLPLILSLENAPSKESSQIIRGIRKDSLDKTIIAETVTFIIQYKGVEQSRLIMYEYRDRALSLLNEFDENPARASLKQLCYFVTERDK
ncbi:MAG: polyprenyl synthetase family protein [Saprospiraceae bacterium]|nr:polyprenyl synthetase family protein [Saprospiraceae bacterium]